jgi:hypothetical protein
MNSGYLNFLEPSGTLQACNGTVFTFLNSSGILAQIMFVAFTHTHTHTHGFKTWGLREESYMDKITFHGTYSWFPVTLFCLYLFTGAVISSDCTASNGVIMIEYRIGKNVKRSGCS